MQSEVYNEKNSKFDSYRYYVVGLKIDGVYYTAKLAVGQKSGESYYDHALTEIEKSNLLNLTNGVKADVSDKEDTLSNIKDKRLISILQVNSSKVVDENGEPQVVYYGSDIAFTEFKPFEDGALGKGMYFSESRVYAKGVRPNA